MSVGQSPVGQNPVAGAAPSSPVVDTRPIVHTTASGVVGVVSGVISGTAPPLVSVHTTGIATALVAGASFTTHRQPTTGTSVVMVAGNGLSLKGVGTRRLKDKQVVVGVSAASSRARVETGTSIVVVAGTATTTATTTAGTAGTHISLTTTSGAAEGVRPGTGTGTTLVVSAGRASRRHTTTATSVTVVAGIAGFSNRITTTGTSVAVTVSAGQSSHQRTATGTSIALVAGGGLLATTSAGIGTSVAVVAGTGYHTHQRTATGTGVVVVAGTAPTTVVALDISTTASGVVGVVSGALTTKLPPPEVHTTGTSVVMVAGNGGVSLKAVRTRRLKDKQIVTGFAATRVGVPDLIISMTSGVHATLVTSSGASTHQRTTTGTSIALVASGALSSHRHAATGVSAALVAGTGQHSHRHTATGMGVVVVAGGGLLTTTSAGGGMGVVVVTGSVTTMHLAPAQVPTSGVGVGVVKSNARPAASTRVNHPGATYVTLVTGRGLAGKRAGSAGSHISLTTTSGAARGGRPTTGVTVTLAAGIALTTALITPPVPVVEREVATSLTDIQLATSLAVSMGRRPGVGTHVSLTAGNATTRGPVYTTCLGIVLVVGAGVHGTKRNVTGSDSLAVTGGAWGLHRAPVSGKHKSFIVGYCPTHIPKILDGSGTGRVLVLGRCRTRGSEALFVVPARLPFPTLTHRGGRLPVLVRETHRQKKQFSRRRRR